MVILSFTRILASKNTTRRRLKYQQVKAFERLNTGVHPMTQHLRCYARGYENEWEAICVDLDLVVEGTSLDDVKARLDSVIEAYVTDALNESPAQSRRLLSRRAPFSVRYGWAFAHIVSMLLGRRTKRNDSGHATAGYEVLCRA